MNSETPKDEVVQPEQAEQPVHLDAAQSLPDIEPSTVGQTSIEPSTTSDVAESQMTTEPATVLPTSSFESPVFDASRGLTTTEIESAATNPNSPKPLPNAFGSPSEVTVASPPKKRMSKRMRVTLLVITIITVLLLIISAVIWYILYFQNPQRVFGVAVNKALSAKTVEYKGSLTLSAKNKSSSKPTTISVGYGGAISDKENATFNLSLDYSGADNSSSSSAPIKISTFLNSESGYVKVADITPAVTIFSGDESLSPSVKEFIRKYNDTWMKFNLDQSQSKSERGEISQCIDSQIDKAFSSGAPTKESIELRLIYQNNDFLILDKNLGTQRIEGTASTGYTVTVDDAKLISYIDAMTRSSFVKNLQGCDESINFNTDNLKSSIKPGSFPVFKIWIGTLSHEFTRIETSLQEDDFTLDFSMQPNFNNKVDIIEPKDAVLFDVVGNDFQRAFYQLESGNQNTLFDTNSTFDLDESDDRITPVILDDNETLQPIPDRT